MKSAFPKYNDLSEESENVISIVCFMVQKNIGEKE